MMRFILRDYTLKSKWTQNAIYSLAGNGITTICTQLFIFPFLANTLSADDNGYMLTCIALINTISMTLGSSLCQVRLLTHKKYEEQAVSGDFGILLVLSIILTALITSAFALITKNLSLLHIIILVIYACLFTFRDFAVVYFLLPLVIVWMDFDEAIINWPSEVLR